MQMALNVILQTCFGLQDWQNTLFALCEIHRITLSASHKHGITAPNSIRYSFLVLHFFLPMASTTVLTMLWKKHALHRGKSRPFLEADLPISTLHNCTKLFEQAVVNATPENRQTAIKVIDAPFGSDWHEARQQQCAIGFHRLGKRLFCPWRKCRKRAAIHRTTIPKFIWTHFNRPHVCILH